jgi:hypothetical protein
MRRNMWLRIRLVVAILCSFAVARGEEAPQPQPRLGINLSGPADWNTELPFVDVFRLSRAWISQRKREAWGKGPPLELDQHGYVKRLEPDCWAETPLCTISSGRFPAGAYTVLYEGKGTIEFNGAKVLSREPGKLTIEVDPSPGGFFLRLMATEPDNYVRNLRVIMPGFVDSYQKNPWHPEFLKRWQGVACLRFMDFMHTNNSDIASWSQRPTPKHATCTTHGVPLELMLDLANRLDADAWFCMPHKADDDFVRRFAQAVKTGLKPGRKAYIEYSNEVWNGQFQQHRYAAEQGQKLKLAEKPWEAAWRYTALRSVEIFKIWEEEFGGVDRLVRVLPSQAANAYVSQQILSFRDAGEHADALAIAPYLSFNISPNGKPSAEEVVTWTADQVLDHLESHSLPESKRWMEENRKVAERYGLKLIAYEGGQHMVGIQGAENNEKLTKLLHQANAHPRLEKVYDRYLSAWEQESGDLFCYFSSVGQWSKWGSWGLLQYYDDPPAESPKARAVLRWARQHGQPVLELP